MLAAKKPENTKFHHPLEGGDKYLTSLFCRRFFRHAKIRTAHGIKDNVRALLGLKNQVQHLGSDVLSRRAEHFKGTTGISRIGHILVIDTEDPGS